MAASQIYRSETRRVSRSFFVGVLGLLYASGGGSAASAGQTQSAALPAGTVLELRLETPVSTRASHLDSEVTARVVREVPACQKIAIPLGAVVRGRLEKLIPSSAPTDRARLRIDFSQLEIPGRPPVTVAGRIKNVENARETVLADGTVQGVLASELPLSRLEDATAKLGKRYPDVEKVVSQAFGRADTTIEFAAGTDCEWVLDQPLAVEGGFEPAVPAVLTGATSAAAAQLLATAPQRASGKDGAPGDPLNFLVIGKADEIRKTFEAAGWSEAAQQNSTSIWETVRAVVAEKGYGAAPVSHLFLYGRQEDLAFEKMLNTFTKRHHLRVWRSPATTPDGREIWLGAATHDTGLDVRPGVVSHAIDPDLDAERAKVGADLEVTGRVAAETLVTRADPLMQGSTATGAPWKTDGRLIAIELKPQ